MPTTDYTPTAHDLAVFMKTRTKTRYGAVVGEFTDTTPVTLEEAGTLISQAVDETALAVGSDAADNLGETMRPASHFPPANDTGTRRW
jgi:hypothetical protein